MLFQKLHALTGAISSVFTLTYESEILNSLPVLTQKVVRQRSNRQSKLILYCYLSML